MIDEESKNKNFIQIYRPYIDNITELASENSMAYKLFMLLIKHMDGNNALCVSVKTLAEIFEVSTKTIARAINHLKNNGWICVLKSGTTNVYIINPDVVWTSYANQKQYCKFQANVLLSATENAEYLKNPDAISHFKTVNSEFIQQIQERKQAFANKGIEFKEQHNNQPDTGQQQENETIKNEKN